MRIVVLLNDAFIFGRIPYRILNALIPERRVASAMLPSATSVITRCSAALAASIRPLDHSTLTQVKRSIPAET
jgi:hypothetical protein